MSQLTNSERRLTELHIGEARSRALRLFMATSTIFPAEWTDWGGLSDMLVTDVHEMAFHARRVIDLCRIDVASFTMVDAVRYSFEPGSETLLVANLREALDRLHHARDMIFVWSVWTGRPVFVTSRANHAPSYVSVTTDIRERANISLYGVAMSYLYEVLPEVSRSFPEYEF